MLLEARKIPTLERWYTRYGRRLLRRSFAQLRVGGAAWPAGDGPVIAFANHSAWWDPIVALVLSHDLFRRDQYGLMDGAQVARYPFFRHVGCFGATSAAPDDVRALSAYAAALLRGASRRLIWIFPQGALLPPGASLAFGSGLARLARAVPEATLVPIALRYEFGAEQRPTCVTRVGEAVSCARGSVRTLTRALERRLAEELCALDHDLARPAGEGLASYTVALAGGRSLSTLYDRSVGRIRGSR